MIKIKNLKKGDRFIFVPRAWFGPGVVTQSYKSGSIWCLKFDAPVVNPPGVFYTEPDFYVRKLRKLL